MLRRRLTGGFINSLLLFFSMLFIFSGCTPFAATNLIESLLPEEQGPSEPSSYLYLATPKITTSRDVEVNADGCFGFSHVVINESTSAPAEDSVMWQPCVNSSTVFTYQISTTTVGEKTLYFHTMLGNRVNSYSKQMKVVYAPKVIIGQSSFNDIDNYKTGFYLPIELHTTGSDLWVSDYSNNRILKYNSLPTSNSTVPDSWTTKLTKSKIKLRWC
jgi:hypothetical protein